MLGTLSEASRRGAPIIVANPLKERGLERFQDPQRPVEMATATSTPLASAYHQVKVGGDVAMLKGIMKALFEADRTNLESGGAGLLDRPFIAKHTIGFDELKADIEETSWDDVVRRSGLTREAIESMARVYWTAKSVIICYGMGITQHRHGTENVQQLANLMLLRGNIGREGAGICPLRGHSNVQGDRTVGITEIPTEAFLARMDAAFGFISPRKHGHGAVEAIVAMREGESKGFMGLGGNMAVAISDPEATFAAFRKLDLNVQICTKLNRTCLLTAKETIVLPCLGRTEQDYQGGQLQSVTVEDSMSMVHASRGMLKPSSPDLLAEPAIVAGIAKAALPQTRVDWDWLIEDYDRVRDKIEEVFPDFYDFNERVRRKGGFRLRVGASDRQWDTPDGKAHFIAFPSTDEDDGKSDTALTLTTIRSHDQYNTTIYGMNDRYRGVTGRRDVVFVHPDDLALFGLGNGDLIDIVSGDRVFARQTAIAYGIARGSMAAYYPEANCLIALDDFDGKSGTPSFKSVPVTLRAAT
jgi:molybdopterin-dependent oxidoreductase alpha subunit